MDPQLYNVYIGYNDVGITCAYSETDACKRTVCGFGFNSIDEYTNSIPGYSAKPPYTSLQMNLLIKQYDGFIHYTKAWVIPSLLDAMPIIVLDGLLNKVQRYTGLYIVPTLEEVRKQFYIQPDDIVLCLCSDWKG